MGIEKPDFFKGLSDEEVYSIPVNKKPEVSVKKKVTPKKAVVKSKAKPVEVQLANEKPSVTTPNAGEVSFNIKKVSDLEIERSSNKVSVAILRDTFERFEKMGMKMGEKRTGVFINKILAEIVSQL
jgi:hypothetical protein